MKKLAILLTLCLITGISFAQRATGLASVKTQANGDMFQGNLYSADKVMAMRDKLEITDAQADRIKKIHAENAGEFTTLKWDLDEETKKLTKMLEADKPDSKAVQAQMDKVLSIENELKKKRLSTLVAIKNELTEEQVDMLKSSNQVVVGSYFFNESTSSPSQVKIINGEAATVTGFKSSSATTFFPDGDNNRVMIRVNSDKEGNQPLYVIDGEVMKTGQKGLKNMNPNDIESISVLKDESATSLYGPDGKDGVIVITTKKGKKKK